MAGNGVVVRCRGFGMSVVTFVPSSGVWWGSYGAYQKLLWGEASSPQNSLVLAALDCRYCLVPAVSGHIGTRGWGWVLDAQVQRWRSSAGAQPVPAQHSSREVLAVQTASAVLAGFTSASLTNGLDVIKTRIQAGQPCCCLDPKTSLTNFDTGRCRSAEARMVGQLLQKCLADIREDGMERRASEGEEYLCRECLWGLWAGGGAGVRAGAARLQGSCDAAVARRGPARVHARHAAAHAERCAVGQLHDHLL